MAASDPVRNQLRDARLSISVLIEQLGNGELTNAKTTSAALKVVIDALDVQIQAAASSAALTLL
jgi:hypothetical protein